MPIFFECEYCHKTFESKHMPSVRHFCCVDHYHMWRKGKKNSEVTSCYYKEARAMLDGKHWEGKNRCTKLPGDES